MIAELSCMTTVDAWLERLSWASQLIVMLIALIAALAAFRQIAAHKLFEIVTFLQDENFRNARRRVIREIWPKKDIEWWHDPDLEAAASSCAGHYDIVGRLLQFRGERGLKRLFVQGWAESIVRNYEILKPFIALRAHHNGNNYEGFTWLYKQAKKHRPEVGNPWPLFE